MTDIELPDFARRIFLSRSLQLLGAAVALPLATKPLLAAGDVAPAAPPLQVLSPAEYAVLAAVADTMIPRGGAFELGAADVDLAGRIDGYLPRMHPDVVTGIHGALAFVEQKAPGLAKKDGTFTALPDADRAAVFSGMLAAPGLAASIFVALKFLCFGHFYTMDRTWKYTGYDGPMLLEDRR
jgi:hypothetical protein